MAGHEHHAAADELVGDGHRLTGVARVVADLQGELLAEHAAIGVDVGDRHLRTVAHLLAERGILAGHGSGGSDGDIGQSGSGERCSDRERDASE